MSRLQAQKFDKALALSAASERLRSVPGFPGHRGRPRKAPTGPNSGHSAGTGPARDRVSSTRESRPEPLQGRALSASRLLDLPGAAAYLAVSPWTVRDLEAAGTLKRVRVPTAGGAELRKLLFDRVDLDRLVEAWKT